jgi:hypothetical protein
MARSKWRKSISKTPSPQKQWQHDLSADLKECHSLEFERIQNFVKNNAYKIGEGHKRLFQQIC